MKKYIITTVAAIFAAFTIANADVTGNLDVSYISNYTYKGQVLDTNPVIAPKLSLSAPLTENTKLVASTEQAFGTQGSSLFRSQYNAGVEVSVGRVTVTPGYEVISFPNSVGVADTQTVTAKLSLDDKGLFLPVALNPSLDLGKQVSGKSGTRAEASVRPKLLSGKLDVALPLAVGWSYDSYYAGYPREVKYAYAAAGLAGEYHVTDRFSVKSAVTGFTTDTKLSNKSSNFLTTSVGVAVSF